MDTDTAKEYYAQAGTLFSGGNFKEALSKVESAIELDKNNDIYLVLKGRICAALQDFEGARKALEAAISINAKNAGAYVHMGNISLICDDVKTALINFNKAVSCGYKQPDAFIRLGDIYTSLGDMDMALRNYSKALREDSLNEEARNKRILLLAGANRFEEAIEDAGEYIAVAPDAYNGYHYKTVLLKNVGRIDEAKEVLNGASSIFPQDAAFKIDMLDVMVAAGEIKEAHELADIIAKEFELEPAEKRHLMMERARIFAMENDTEGILDALSTARSLSEGDDVEIDYMLTSCYLSVKQYDKAIEAAKRVIQTGERDYVCAALYMLPLAYLQKGDAQTARQKFEESANILRDITFESETAMDAYYFRALCLEALGEKEKASEIAEFLINVDSQNESFNDLHNRLASEKEAYSQD